MRPRSPYAGPPPRPLCRPPATRRNTVARGRRAGPGRSGMPTRRRRCTAPRAVAARPPLRDRCTCL
eukprot:6131837-Pleurochrysis_carterae.AAC.1